MKLTCSAFENEGKIPSRYTCEGIGVSLPLEIAEIPKGTKSLVLLMDDPDVPKNLRADGMWDHWVVFNIPPDTRRIAEGQEPPGTPGKGTNGKTGYYGPCPPDREHRYFLRVYALDTMLDLAEGADKKSVEAALKGHVLQEASLMGRYERGN